MTKASQKRYFVYIRSVTVPHSLVLYWPAINQVIRIVVLIYNNMHIFEYINFWRSFILSWALSLCWVSPIEFSTQWNISSGSFNTNWQIWKWQNKCFWTVCKSFFYLHFLKQFLKQLWKHLSYLISNKCHLFCQCFKLVSYMVELVKLIIIQLQVKVSYFAVLISAV